MRVVWVQDETPYMGGAELVCRDLLEEAPGKVDIVFAHPEIIPEGDVFVVHNCVTFDTRLLKALEGKPVVKQVHDFWTEGNDAVRAALLHSPKTRLVFSSQLHVRKFPWRFTAPHVVTPPCVSASRYAEPPEHEGKVRNHRAAWIGRMVHGKGITRTVRWGQRNGVRVDFYGYGPGVEQVPRDLYLGALDPDDVPPLLREYSMFVFLPDLVEPYGRTVVEAAWAGCKLILNPNVGATEWLDHPRAIAQSGSAFWSMVTSNCKKGNRKR